jgi:hypothetical protein
VRTLLRSIVALSDTLPSATKDFDGIIGKWSFDENGDTMLEMAAGFKVEKAANPIGCRFAFEVVPA